VDEKSKFVRRSDLHGRLLMCISGMLRLGGKKWMAVAEAAIPVRAEESAMMPRWRRYFCLRQYGYGRGTTAKKITYLES
jgi:hypothetical protein